MFLKRKSLEKAAEILKETQILYINGIRQCGKSTLAMQLASQFGLEYLSFDSPSILAAAQHDPQAFIENIKSNIVIDEVQMAPEIFRNLKIFVDEQRRKNADQQLKILLTGSANILLLPKLADSLVGRMQIMTLYPFGYSEFSNSTFLNDAFSGNFRLQNHNRRDIIPMIRKATFPELSINLKANASRWFDAYLTTLLTRDIREITNIARTSDMYTMLKILAARTGSLINESSLARDCNMNLMTFRRYRNILENMFVIQRAFPWFRNIGKRFVKSTKNYFTDTYMLCNILGVDLLTIQQKDPILFGQILENFVFTELIKNMDEQMRLFHFHTSDNKEVDFVLEKNNGDLVGIEVKSKSSVSEKDFEGIRELKNSAGSSFKCGIVLYLGNSTIPFAQDMFAVSMQML